MSSSVQPDAPTSPASRTLVEAYVRDVDMHMRALLQPYEGTIATAARGQIDAGGKRLRPLLVRAALPLRVAHLAAHDRTGIDAATVRAGAAIELIHTATLIHDDQLDGATTRRGVPTAGATLGHQGAVAAGDLLFSLAFATLVECRAEIDEAAVQRCVQTLARTARTLAEGEALQARQIRDPFLPESAYLHRCSCKTGVLFTAALQIGATIARASAQDIEMLGRFGELVGIAFQLTDDILDCGTPDTAQQLGKRPGADVRDGTITLPMLIAVQLDPALAALLQGHTATDEAEAVLTRIRANGAIELARDRAIATRDSALALLEQLAPAFDVEPLRIVAMRSVDRIA